MEKLSIYEYVAVIVPGVAFLFGLGAMLPDGALLQIVLLPRDMGTAAIHLFLAFALGHMLQVLGQLVHRPYWTDFGGLPTDWPFTREHTELSPDIKQVVLNAAGQAKADDLVQWRRAIATARSLVTAGGFARRLETFQANYGMFRSLAVAAILLLLAAPWCGVNLLSIGPVICGVFVVSLLGMHSFGVHYARELFSAIRAWSHEYLPTALQERNDSEPNILRITPRRAERPRIAA